MRKLSWEEPHWLDMADDEVVAAIKAIPVHRADLSVTAASVVLVSGAPTIGTTGAGVTVTAGQVVYPITPGVFGLAKAQTVGKQNPTGIALSGAGPGLPFLVAGVGCQVTIGATVVKGTAYINSGAVAGNIAVIGDLTTSWLEFLIGFAPNTTDIILAMLNTTVQF